MQKLVISPEAHASFQATGVCVVELAHDEVLPDEQYDIGLGDECEIVVVVTTQKPQSGTRSHIQLAVLMDAEHHIG